MSFADNYLSRHIVSNKIPFSPHPNLHYIVVIPCYNEPGLIQTLASLWECTRPSKAVEVIVVINSASDTPVKILENNQLTLNDAIKWKAQHEEPTFRFHIINEIDLPSKDAGPGLARKIGMDQAIIRFNRLKRPEGVILSFDADCTCDRNYFTEIEQQFTRESKTKGCTIHFEHPITGNDFPPITYHAITEYELHLRYYIQAIRNTGFPHAYHAVGSCFCINASTYVNQGGMNKRKGGEDFYFLQKVIPLGHFYEINTTTVYPSPRPSDRVPFGTGPVIQKYILNANGTIQTYHPGAFKELIELLSKPEKWFQCNDQEFNQMFNALPVNLKAFLGQEFKSRITEINSNAASEKTFVQRFFRWFNMFKILKYLNFVHEKVYEKIAVEQAAKALLMEMGIEVEKLDSKELLLVFRQVQKK